MATSAIRRKPMGLPGKQIAPQQFPPRSSSYKALSIIDAYGAGFEEITPPPLPKDAPRIVLKTVQKLKSKHETVSSMYGSDFDIDEAYGSGEAELTDEMVGATEMYDEYDPYKVTSPPPRVSSMLPLAREKELPKVQMVEIKPDPPAKPAQSNNDREFDPYRPLTPPPKDSQIGVREKKTLLTSPQPKDSQTSVRDTKSPIISPPPKDSARSMKENNGIWKMGANSTSQIDMLSEVKGKSLPSIPRKKVLTPNLTGQKELPGIPSGTIEDLRARKDSMMLSEKGKQFLSLCDERVLTLVKHNNP